MKLSYRVNVGDNNALRGGKDIRKEPKRNMKVLASLDHTFNSDIHVMILNPKGKGFIQKLKSDIK